MSKPASVAIIPENKHRILPFDDRYGKKIAVWCLRSLVHLGGYKHIFAGRPSRLNGNESVLCAIGLDHVRDEAIAPDVALQLLKERLIIVEQKNPRFDGILSRNLELLGEALSLSGAEREIIAFAALLRTSAALGEVTNALSVEWNTAILIEVLALILDLPTAEVRTALCPDGTLLASGLLRFDTRSLSWLNQKLDLLDGLADALLLEQPDAVGMLQNFFHSSAQPLLCKDDFLHISEDYQLLLSYVQATLRAGTRGVNILVHGPPGTGKTQCVRTIAKAVGITLYEVCT